MSMASDLWQKLKCKVLNKVMEEIIPSDLSELTDQDSIAKLKRLSGIEQNDDWTQFEKYFAKDLIQDDEGHVRNKFLIELVKMLDQYLKSQFKRNSKVLDFHHPHQLKEIMDHCLQIDKEPQNLEEILSDCRETLKYCVKTGHPRFLNQLSTGINIIGVAGEMLTATANTNMFTYEVAPVFTLTEEVVIHKMLGYVGWPDGEGIFAPGGAISNLYGMLAARHKRFPDIKRTGMSGGAISNLYGMLAARHKRFPDIKRTGMSGLGIIDVFTSKQSHFSVNKAAVLLGIGLDHVVTVDCDARGKMKVCDLKMKIKRSLEQNHIPLMVNATCGTTVLGAYDPVNQIADVCEEFGVWLHVDGAWGGSALLSEKHRHLLHGVHRADSMTWNPHKMMGAPLQCSAIMLREKGILMDVNKTGATYLYHKDKHYDTSYDTGDMTIQCGRHNDVFKLWLMWRSKGDNGFREQIDKFFSLAKYLVGEINKRPNFRLVLEEIEGPNVSFWYIPPNLAAAKRDAGWKEELNKVAPNLKALMLEKGTIMVTYQPLDDLPNFFRIAVSNPALTRSDLDFVLDEIEGLAENL